VKWCY